MASTVGELDWDDLRYFLRAVEARTLAGAARALGVEHTTIGRRLTALEHALGAPLVLRGPDGLRLTPLGEKIAPLVAGVERAVADVREAAVTQRSHVRLAAPTGMTRLFTTRLHELNAAHPALTLEIVSGSRPVDLMKGEADMAIRSGPCGDNPDLVARKLCDSGFSLYASDAYLARHPAPLNLDDLDGHELIGFDRSLSSSPAAQWIEERARGAKIVLRSREMTEMAEAAASGAGLAVLPCAVGAVHPDLRRVTPRVLATRALSLVYRREARLSPEVRAVIRFVVNVVRENAATIGGS